MELKLEEKSFIRENFQPVFLGNTRQSRRLSRELYKKYGIVSYIAHSKRPFLCDLCLSRTFFRVAGPSFGDLLADELLYLFSFDPACIYVAVPFTEEYSRFLSEYRDKLSPACVIREADTIFLDIPFINNEDGGHSK